MTEHSKIILYVDMLSQPSRTVLWFCLNSNLPNFEVKIIEIMKGENKTEEFKKM